MTSPSGWLLRCSGGGGLFGCLALATMTSVSAEEPKLRFSRQLLTDLYYCDGINTADINADGVMDIIAGPFWYIGPDFSTAYPFYEPAPLPPETTPSNSMFSFPYDFNGDGWTDILVLGRHRFHSAYWYENPGPAAAMNPSARWKRHFAMHRVAGESPAFIDVDGDGRPEVVSFLGHSPDDELKQLGWYSPDWSNPTAAWRFLPVTEREPFPHNYHGMGVGDINGDGRLDLVLTEGWWEQPPRDTAPGTRWKKHPFVLSTDVGGAQILVYDINGDGLNDVFTAKNAHGWGLSWFEQVRDGAGLITFREHRVMGTRAEESRFGVAFSQPHALALADFDGDGIPDVLTGKRRWAHGPTGDVEPMETPAVYLFLSRRDSGADGGARFLARLVDNKSGVGVQVVGADVTRDGVPDVLTVSKLGTFVFVTERDP